MYPKRSLHIFLFLVFVLLGSTAQAQSNEPSEALFKTVQSLDTQLFDAYNHCDLTKLGAMVEQPRVTAVWEPWVRINNIRHRSAERPTRSNSGALKKCFSFGRSARGAPLRPAAARKGFVCALPRVPRAWRSHDLRLPNSLHPGLSSAVPQAAKKKPQDPSATLRMTRHSARYL